MKISFLFFSLCIFRAQATVRVVTTTTEVAWLVEKVGGSEVTVESLLDGSEDPNYVDDKPEWLPHVQSSDLLCLVGRDLEIGWIARLIEKTKRAELFPGKLRYCELSETVNLRQESDAYPRGSPYFWLSPLRFAEASGAVEKALSRVDPFHAANYAERGRKLRAEMKSQFTMLKSQLKTSDLQSPLVEYGEEFRYFLLDYGVSELGNLETLPGYPPAPRWVGERAAESKKKHVKALLASSLNPTRPVKRFSELAGIPAWIEATHLRRGQDYFEFQQNLFAHLAAHLRE
jgi:zinc/manganese transport system substrate-binding protein